MKRVLLEAFIAAAAVIGPRLADAQPRSRSAGSSSSSAPAAPGTPLPTNVKSRVGTEYAARLIRSTETEERIRGVQRAVAIGTPEAVALLVQAAEGSAGPRADSRSSIELTRGLARFADQERVRTALLSIVNGASRASDRRAETDDGDPLARGELARSIAAIALARSGVERALEQLYGVARGTGSGQAAAILALSLEPPRDPGFFGTAGNAMPPAVVKMLGQLGDLRAIEVLHAAARSADVNVRGPAILALAELGDERAVGLARTAIAESDARLRAFSGEAFVLLGAPERFQAVTALIGDEATVAIGVKLAERVFSLEISRLLAARVMVHPDREVRASCIRALGRSPEAPAATALTTPALLADPVFGYEAALALARSPAPNASELVAGLTTGPHAALGVRAYVVRALVRGARDGKADGAVERLLASKDGAARALGAFATVALGGDAGSLLADGDVRVRRAAALGVQARPSAKTDHLLLARLAVEKDAATRQVLASGLAGADPDALVTTTQLIDRAESGGADAALSAFTLATRADESLERKVGQLLAARDPVLRAHTARGLAASRLPDAAGRLAGAYAYETDPSVRLALVSALAARTGDTTSPSRQRTLELAATLDPDGPTRQAARRGLLAVAGRPQAEGLRSARTSGFEAAWLRVVPATAQKAGTEPYVATLVRSDGVATPIVFDDDGFAIVGGLPPGEARLVLAPRLPSYEARTP